MLQAAISDLFNPLVPKPHHRECQYLLFPLQNTLLSQLKLVCEFFAPSALMG